MSSKTKPSPVAHSDLTLDNLSRVIHLRMFFQLTSLRSSHCCRMSHTDEGKPQTFLDVVPFRHYCASPGCLLIPQVTREGWSLQTGEFAHLRL